MPLLIQKENKWSMGALLALVTGFLYLTSNHFQIFEPQLLHMTWIDRAVPFIPQTVWIYVSEYLLFFTVYWQCKKIENLNRYAFAFLAQQVFSVMVFWTWPTIYPRELFPLPQNLDPFTNFIFEQLRTADAPTNCCPSLHVSSVYLCSMMFLHEQRHKFPFFFTWATAIAVSTLTTKQHYFIDVVAGFIVAVFFLKIAQKFVQFQQR